MSLDMAMANIGVVFGEFDENGLQPTGHTTVSTNKAKKPNYVFEDDIGRCKVLYDIIQGLLHSEYPDYLFLEVPTGSQSGRAGISCGAMYMLAASLESSIKGWRGKVMYCTPISTKRVVRDDWVGVKGVPAPDKREMIDWAVSNYPNFSWIRNKKGEAMAKNEHVADALAIAQHCYDKLMNDEV